MARRTPMMGTLTDMAPSGGGTFSRTNDQPMPPRDGMLCLLTARDEGQCCDGGCCGDAECQEPAPPTATAPGMTISNVGVQDTALALRWTDTEA
jgi:hypothetical protein